MEPGEIYSNMISSTNSITAFLTIPEIVKNIDLTRESSEDDFRGFLY